MKLILLLVTLLILVPGLSAQVNDSQPPPPAPVAKGTAPLYESEDGSYKVRFPAKPAVNRTSSDSSFGKSEVVTAYLSTGLASYAVVYIDFPTVMEDRYDLNIRFDAMRDGQIKTLKAKVVNDVEFFFGSHYGRENSYESATSTTSSRAIVAGPRIFVLSIDTRGKLSTQTGKALEGNKKLIADFFNSFQITKIPQAKQTAAPFPADFGVSITDGQFNSSYLEVGMKAPAAWSSLDRESIDLLMGIGKDEVKKTDAVLAERMSDEMFRTLAVFSKVDINKGASNAMIFVMAEKAPYPGFLPLAVASTYTKLYLEPGEKLTIAPAETKINNVDLAWIETHEPAVKLNKRFYFANRKGISFLVMLTYTDPADLKTMLASLQTLKITGAATK